MKRDGKKYLKSLLWTQVMMYSFWIGPYMLPHNAEAAHRIHHTVDDRIIYWML